MSEFIVEVSPERAGELIEKISKYIVERHMAPAAIMAIESLKPLNFIGSQFMYFVLPVAELIFDSKGYQEFAALIEKDEYVDILVKRIDELDESMHREEREQARLMRIRRRKRLREWFKRILHK